MSVAADVATEPDRSLAYLLGRLAVVEVAVRDAVARRAAADPHPGDALRGVYLSDSYVAWLLDGPSAPGGGHGAGNRGGHGTGNRGGHGAGNRGGHGAGNRGGHGAGNRGGHGAGPGETGATALGASVRAMRERLEDDADVAETGGADIRLRRLSRTFGLTGLDEDLLVVALAPMLDRRFGPLLAYLNDDVTRPYASVAVAVELARAQVPGDPRDWLRLSPAAPLVARRLVEVADVQSPLPSRTVRPAERVTAFLLGDDSPDATLAGYLREVASLPLLDPALRGLPRSGALLVRQRPGTDAVVEATSWLAAGGTTPLVAGLPSAEQDESVAEVAALLARECLLRGTGLVLGPLDGVGRAGEVRLGVGLGPPPWRAEAAAGAVRELLRQVRPVVLWSTGDVDATWLDVPIPVVELGVPPVGHRFAAWAALTDGLDLGDADLTALAGNHRIGAAHVRRAVETARAATALSTAPPALPDRAALERGVAALDGPAMREQARRIRPGRTWEHLVLPGGTRRQLRELIGLIRRRDQVADEWGLARGGAARGVAALFVGPSGTGKTLAAEVVAHELGVDLYTIDLARVVDKYVGETEKNLERVLAAAEGVTGILFFDEADALFGRRGDVKGGQDRYANLEVSYLLQRVEAFGGVVVLATNLRSHVDEAFVRRLDSVVEFTAPDEAARAALWRRHLSRVACADDVDLDFCARSFELNGGSIRNVAVAAACLAEDAGRVVVMADLVRAVEREYQKLGRLRARSDFGAYAELLGRDG